MSDEALCGDGPDARHCPVYWTQASQLEARDRELAQARKSLEDQVAENARQSAANARLSRELAEARAAIVALTPGAGEPQYAVVEAMGHRTLIGAISDVTVAGKAMLRLGRLDGHGEHYLAPDSLYMVTPCSESQARAAASRLYGGLPATVLAAIGTGDVLEEEALHHEVAAGAWGSDEDDPSNSDVDPDAYPDERDTDDDDREVIAPGDQDHGWPGPKGPF